MNFILLFSRFLLYVVIESLKRWKGLVVIGKKEKEDFIEEFSGLKDEKELMVMLGHC